MPTPGSFHPAVQTWFEGRFALGPTAPQARGWPAIAAGRDTLIAAPTGSGKTLAAFLVCIDRLYRRAEQLGGLEDAVDVVYVSPLKALAVDIQHNLETPLREIAEQAERLGHAAPEIRVLVRSGDTPPAARAALLRRPPHLLVTTPESLYLQLTAARSRETLRRVRSVIVDEIHAVARDKRGSHLALSLERLDALCETPPQRIGLSATQRPIDAIARLLVGARPRPAECAVVDVGHRRDMDLAVEVPDSELGAVASHEQWGEILDRIAAHVRARRTTLIFANTRRLAERVAHLLGERLGEERVAAHHGSLSKERRLRVEARLRAGELSALVATASLELGIDVGPVELVCQLGSPRAIATLLQRVGRSGHSRAGTPVGRLYPTSRDELVECAALVRGVRSGGLDCVRPPRAPLDILAQQIVAACAAEPWSEDALFALVRGAAPYAELSRADFDAVVEMLAEGIQTGRGRRGAWLHRDRVNGVLRGRRGARLAALTSGGAIPDTADYRVVADPDETFVGTVNEDWAIESMAGDVFLLGTTSWRIRRVEAGTVRVTDARGLPPSVPFWLGEAPARSAELSAEVSALRAEVEARLEAGAEAWLREHCGLDAGGACQIVRYLGATRAVLGRVPTASDVVVERFFDETGGMQLVLHAPFGGRVNRALGLLARKRICRRFDFELQAAANDDAVVLSLGPQHSFPLDDVRHLLGPQGAAEALEQAVLLAPMFTARWRWNLGRALSVLRFRGGRRNPPPLQRMEADDLMAAVWPGLAACQENQVGPLELPEHPLARQTLADCLSEALDAAGLLELLADIERGAVRLHARETREPSPAAHEILNGKPYTFLDDAPLEERRTRAVVLRRALPVEERDLAHLDADAIARVCDEARLAPRDAEELHDALLGSVLLRPLEAWRDWHAELARQGRAASIATSEGSLWLAAERRPAAEALFPGAPIAPDVRAAGAAPCDRERAAAELLRGQLESAGPSTLAELSRRCALPSALLEQAAARLEAEGFLLRGRFRPDAAGEELCSRRLLARIHRYTQERLRREIEPVSARDFLRFLLRWQHVAPGTEREGRRGTLAAVEQLQGFELAAGAWEQSVLPARIAGYQSAWLDELCLSGDVVWGRLAPPAAGDAALAPSRATPITLALREDLPWLLAAARGDTKTCETAPGIARQILALLEERGALFQGDLAAATGAEPAAVDAALWDLVARGLVAADGFQALRHLLGARRAESGGRERLRRRRRGGARRPGAEGRWARLPAACGGDDADELAEAVADQLLARWGVVFRDVLTRESLTLPWRELLWALRRMEARGQLRGGRFVSGCVGEQFALPGAVDALRRTRRLPRRDEVVTLSAADPLNLIGILTPGPRIPAVAARMLTYRDGLAEEAAPAAIGVSP